MPGTTLAIDPIPATPTAKPAVPPPFSPSPIPACPPSQPAKPANKSVPLSSPICSSVTAAVGSNATPLPAAPSATKLSPPTGPPPTFNPTRLAPEAAGSGRKIGGPYTFVIANKDVNNNFRDPSNLSPQ